MKRLITILFTLIVLLLLSFGAKYILLSRASYVSLPNSELDIAISKSLVTSEYPNYLPVLGKDYSIKSEHYFNNQNWVVVYIQPIGTSADSDILILEKTDGAYRGIVGPVNSLQGANLNGVPSTVVNYIEGN